MSIDKLPVFENFPPGKDQGRLVLWIKGMYRSVSRRINFLLSLVNSGFVEIPADDVAPGTDGNWRWRVDSSGDLVLQRLVAGTWTDTTIKVLPTGLLITNPSQDWKFSATQTAGALGLQSQASGVQARLQLFSNDGDETDNVFIDIFGQGTPADISTSHKLAFGYSQSDNDYILASASKSLRFHSGGGVIQITLKTDGSTNIGGFLVFPKASGNGIKVDQTTPTFGFADLLGDQFTKNTGGTKPALVAYNGDIDAWQFGNGDEAFLSYHIPHDYVLGTDVHLHIHWSQNAAGATGGTLDFKYTAIYAKGHNQASGSTFTTVPKTAAFSSIDISGGSGTDQYQHHFTEVTISAASATAALFDRDDFEPDGVIELTLEMTTTNLTGTPSLPFIHFVDIHYQTTGVIGTKNRTPDFYS